MNLRSTWDWALEYVGDPNSWYERGKIFLDFLREEGLRPSDRVLEIGCGNLSSGVPLIRYLDQGNYVGVEPNGWLVNAAVDTFPDLAEKEPTFLYRTDFAVAEDDPGPFKFILAHSVLSHVAHWQMAQALYKIREVAAPGAKWLATVRLGTEDDFAAEWAYPGVNRFRMETIESLAYQAGWTVWRLYGHEERLQAVAPNDTHEILCFRATLDPNMANALRLDMDARVKEDAEVKDLAKQLIAEREKKRLEEVENGNA